MKIVTGKAGTPHVTSHEFRQIMEGTIGQESYILQSGNNLEPELVSNNLLKIKSGAMAHHGNISSVENYDEIELTNGSQGVKRIDLVVNRYTRNDETKIETNEWVVITGTPDASAPVVPGYTIGNLQDGDLVDDCPVFEIELDGLNVVDIRKKLDVADNVSQLQEKLTNIQESISGLNGKVPQCIFVGTKAFTVSAKDYVELFTVNKLKELTGIDDLSRKNTTVIATNGDGASASDIHPVSVDYWGDNYNAWYAYFNKSFTGSVRIDCAVFYTPDKEMVNW